MAHNRRKSNGCNRGKFKKKKMGKGWSSHRVQRGRPLPIERPADDAAPKAGTAKSDA